MEDEAAVVAQSASLSAATKYPRHVYSTYLPDDLARDAFQRTDPKFPLDSIFIYSARSIKTEKEGTFLSRFSIGSVLVYFWTVIRSNSNREN